MLKQLLVIAICFQGFCKSFLLILDLSLKLRLTGNKQLTDQNVTFKISLAIKNLIPTVFKHEQETKFILSFQEST